MNKRLYTVAALTSVTLVVSIGVGIWVVLSEGRKSRQKMVRSMTTEVECYNCQKCFQINKTYSSQCEKLRPQCKRHKSEFVGVISSDCKNDPVLAEFTTETVKNKYEETKRKFQERHRNKTILDFLSASETSFYNPGKFVAHFPLIPLQQVKPNVWIKVMEYVTHDSKHTVLGTNTVLISEGEILIPKSGLYHIYAKITFACTEADKLSKTLSVEIVNDKTFENTTLLSDTQTATCEEKGDLLTMFQSGLIRLISNSKIFLQYKVPDNVVISSHDTRNNYYKSNIGMYWFGLG